MNNILNRFYNLKVLSAATEMLDAVGSVIENSADCMDDNVATACYKMVDKYESLKETTNDSEIIARIEEASSMLRDSIEQLNSIYHEFA